MARPGRLRRMLLGLRDGLGRRSSRQPTWYSMDRTFPCCGQVSGRLFFRRVWKARPFLLPNRLEHILLLSLSWLSWFSEFRHSQGSEIPLSYKSEGSMPLSCAYIWPFRVTMTSEKLRLR